MNKLQKHLNEKIKQLPKNANIFVGYSGGDDSSALLHILSGLDEAKKRNLKAININHQIHPDSDKWSDICKENAKVWGVDYESVKVKVVLDGKGIESAARDARYGVFENLFKENDYLITAHHMQDQAETFLMRALRGSSVDGLSAMSETRKLGNGWLYRPMLDVDKKDITQYIKDNEIITVFDPSNLDNSLDRCFIRNEIIPLLEKKWPQAVSGLSNSAFMSKEASDILIEEDKLALNKILNNENVFNVEKLFDTLNGDDKKIKRVIVYWMKNHLHEKISKNGVDEIFKLSKNLLDKNDTKSLFETESGTLRFWGGQIYFIDKNLNKDLQKTIKSNDLEKHGYIISFKKDNPKMKIRGRKFSQSFKNIMQEIKVPPWERDSIEILKNKNNEVVRIGKYWIDKEFSDFLENRGNLNNKNKQGFKIKR